MLVGEKAATTKDIIFQRFEEAMKKQQQQQQQQQQLLQLRGKHNIGKAGIDVEGGSNTNDKAIKVELNGEEVQDLEALSELVPGLRSGQVGVGTIAVPSPNNGTVAAVAGVNPNQNQDADEDAFKSIPNVDSMAVNNGEADDNGNGIGRGIKNHGNNTTAEFKNVLAGVQEGDDDNDESSEEDGDDGGDANTHLSPNTNELIHNYTTAKPTRRSDDSSDDSYKSTTAKTHSSGGKHKKVSPGKSMHANKATPHRGNNNTDNNIGNNNLQHPYSRKSGDRHIDTPPRPPNHNPSIPDESLYGSTPMQSRMDAAGPGGDGNNNNNWNPNTSSGQSISTATQSHEIRMPMFLPTFRPATGCTNASDFIVRCFVARLRSGITVVKHGRSRWCKSRLRILHVHSDGRSLSWKPAQGEPSSSKRPPKLDLSTCLEVRHAWSPDPLNPMFTGTPILRSKCEASNAFKSFALIFPRRTVDITAVTADQCKVLMEGFSALCFRLQVASMAGRGRTGNSVSMTNDEGGSNGGNSGGAGPGGNSGPKTGKEERGTVTTSITGTTNTSKRKH